MSFDGLFTRAMWHVYNFATVLKISEFDAPHVDNEYNAT